MKIISVFRNDGKKWIKLEGVQAWFYKKFHWLFRGGVRK